MQEIHLNPGQMINHNISGGLHKISGAHRMAVTLHSVIQPECTQRIISSSDTYLSNYYPFSTVRDQMNAVEGRKEKFDCF